MVSSEYCFYATNTCMTMAEWGVIGQFFGVILSAAVGVFGVIKILSELKRANTQRQTEIEDRAVAANLKRIEFFLSQHRRLFDDEDLYEVLSYLDDDNVKLSDESMWDKNRKFLTFIEEIGLLVAAKQIDEEVAYYMFGHYARCAKDGDHFNEGIDTSEEHWRVFNDFCKKSRTYDAQLKLKLSIIPNFASRELQS